MITWIYRALVLAGCPLVTYFMISRDKTGFWVGLAVGAALVAIEMIIESISLLTIVSGTLGAGAGIFVSKILDYFVFQMKRDRLYEIWNKYEVLRNFAMAILGSFVFIHKFPELDTLDKDILATAKRRGADLKVVDTSAIIDGRIVDICETKFLSGTLVVPRFILAELQHLADSPDGMKRARGRRGLDMLARLQEGQAVPVRILDREIPEIDEIDAKVVRLAKELGAKVLTTDFNLNKVAALEGISCLNVNDLTTALKAVVLPGETMTIFVMKEGKERDQGVGYLDDGTMVVVEEGKRHIGKRVEAQVASILQTSAGRMVFTKFKGERG